MLEPMRHQGELLINISDQLLNEFIDNCADYFHRMSRIDSSVIS